MRNAIPIGTSLNECRRNLGGMKVYTVDASGHPRFKLEVYICKRRDRTGEREER
jgi:hypothetical protein